MCPPWWCNYFYTYRVSFFFKQACLSKSFPSLCFCLWHLYSIMQRGLMVTGMDWHTGDPSSIPVSENFSKYWKIGSFVVLWLASLTSNPEVLGSNPKFWGVSWFFNKIKMAAISAEFPEIILFTYYDIVLFSKRGRCRLEKRIIPAIMLKEKFIMHFKNNIEMFSKITIWNKVFIIGIIKLIIIFINFIIRMDIAIFTV